MIQACLPGQCSDFYFICPRNFNSKNGFGVPKAMVPLGLKHTNRMLGFSPFISGVSHAANSSGGRADDENLMSRLKSKLSPVLVVWKKNAESVEVLPISSAKLLFRKTISSGS